MYSTCTYDMYMEALLYVIAEPLGEAGNRGARSRNAFVCMYVCMYIYIYIYIRPSQLLSPRSIAQ